MLLAGPAPISDHPSPTGTSDNTPQIINDRGRESYRSRQVSNPLIWGHEEGNGSAAAGVWPTVVAAPIGVGARGGRGLQGAASIAGLPIDHGLIRLCDNVCRLGRFAPNRLNRPSFTSLLSTRIQCGVARIVDSGPCSPSGLGWRMEVGSQWSRAFRASSVRQTRPMNRKTMAKMCQSMV